MQEPQALRLGNAEATGAAPTAASAAGRSSHRARPSDAGEDGTRNAFAAGASSTRSNDPMCRTRIDAWCHGRAEDGAWTSWHQVQASFKQSARRPPAEQEAAYLTGTVPAGGLQSSW